MYVAKERGERWGTRRMYVYLKGLDYTQHKCPRESTRLFFVFVQTEWDNRDVLLLLTIVIYRDFKKKEKNTKKI